MKNSNFIGNSWVRCPLKVVPNLFIVYAFRFGNMLTDSNVYI